MSPAAWLKFVEDAALPSRIMNQSDCYRRVSELCLNAKICGSQHGIFRLRDLQESALRNEVPVALYYL